MSTPTLAREAAETAEGARRQLATWATPLAELVAELRAHPPTVIVTCARGSSDHAATYGRYVLETTVGRVVASMGPSVASTYGRAPAGLAGALVIAVSQSGRSPDLVELATAARGHGAHVLGLVNAEGSPLAAVCDRVLPLCAGPETSIAATKSCLLAGLGFLQLAAAWTGDPALAAAAAAAPDAFDAACALDWTAALAPLATATSLYVLGRGVGLGAAAELALKLKETCGLHAEAFSTAEVVHGPVALVGPGFPILALGQDDETAAGTRAVLARLVGLRADVATTMPVAGARTLPVVAGVPSVLAPLCALQSAYLALPALAALRGLDPEAPRHLAKITETR